MRRSIATVTLSGTLQEKLYAIAAKSGELGSPFFSNTVPRVVP